MHIPEAVKSILASPHVFNLYNLLIGAKRASSIFIHEYVKPQPGMRVLDVGCGNGRLTSYFKGTQYTGIDSSASYIKNARKAYPWAQFICGDVCAETLQAASADRVIISGVLHHLDDAQCGELLKSLASVLTSEGLLVLIEPAYVEDQNRLARWVIKNDRGNHVRWVNEYMNLLAADFTLVESAIRHDLLNIPFTHGIYRAVPKQGGQKAIAPGL